MKYMILTYALQQDYDGMAGKATDKPAWSADDFAAMGAFMGAAPCRTMSPPTPWRTFGRSPSPRPSSSSDRSRA